MRINGTDFANFTEHAYTLLFVIIILWVFTCFPSGGFPFRQQKVAVSSTIQQLN